MKAFSRSPAVLTHIRCDVSTCTNSSLLAILEDKQESNRLVGTKRIAEELLEKDEKGVTLMMKEEEKNEATDDEEDEWDDELWCVLWTKTRLE